MTKTAYCMIPFAENVQNGQGKSVETESILVIPRAWRKIELRITA